MIDLGRLERVARRAMLGGDLRAGTALPGRRRGARRPQGLTFAGHRAYQFGDDVRHMDWRVTARIGQPFVKTFRQAPAGTVLVLADGSGSARAGARPHDPPPPVLDVAALTVLIAAYADERVGLALFTDRIEWRSALATGRRPALAAIRALERHQPSSPQTALGPCLSAAVRLVDAPATLVLVSDFIDRGYEPAIREARRHHHLVALCVTVPDVPLPRAGLTRLADPESGRARWVDTADRRVVDGIAQARRRFAGERRHLFASLGVPHIEVVSGTAWLGMASRIGTAL